MMFTFLNISFYSIWSDVSVSQASSTQHRDNMLKRAYGSQIDLGNR